MSHNSPKIVVYMKTYCGWCEGVRTVMRKYNLAYEKKDIIINPAFRKEMEQLSGQALAPCVEIDGHMLVAISGEEMEKWLIQNEYVQKGGAPPPPAAPPPPTATGSHTGGHHKIPDREPPRRQTKTGKIRFFD